MRIAARFNGPPGSANGGVAAGRLASYVGARTVEVTLHRPPPLDVDLRVDASGGTARLLHGALLVAEAVPCDDELEPGDAVGLDTARAAARSYPGLVEHPYPDCYACGTTRADGLGVHPGPVGEGRVAGVWTPEDEDPATVWAALDCPGGWATDLAGDPKVLGRMALTRLAPVAPGAPHVVTGWVLGEAGRKTHTGTALRTAEGALVAVARSTWLTVSR